MSIQTILSEFVLSVFALSFGAGAYVVIRGFFWFLGV